MMDTAAKEQITAALTGLLLAFAVAEKVSTAGDSFSLEFSRAAHAVRFVIPPQHRLRGLRA
jgi:hypothetical protein